MTRGPFQHVRAAAWLFALSLGGCEPQYPIEYETEHLRVAKTFDAPICMGTLRAMELDAARISQQLSGQDHAPLDLVLGIEAVSQHCPADSDGCAHAGGGPIWTNFDSVGHELVHAFASVAGHNSFIDEGLAEALGGGRFNIHRLDVDASSVELSAAFISPDAGGDAGYAVAGHFVVWLLEHRGLDLFLKFRAAVNEGAELPAIASTFEAVYGLSLEAAEASWRDTAPSVYKVGDGDCGGPTEAWLDDRRWAGQLVADCSADDTFGPIGSAISVQPGMRRTLLVDVLRDGSHEFSFSASRSGTLEIESFSCGCWGGPETRERYDITAESRSVSVELWPCRYRISYVVAGVEAAIADVTLELSEADP